MNINWENIKDGYRGFERLALEYVKDVFKNPTWKKTKETRDGNKDAVAYIFGFKGSSVQGVQWWMEAKYSTEKQYTTRYRLDSTVVSALLEDNIDRVIFVTNTLVLSKTITDIRRALLKSTNCKTVNFCTKHALEYWLLKNSEVLERYFNIKNLNNMDAYCYQYAFLTQEIYFYNFETNGIAFIESARELFVGQTYSCHFSIYSPKKMEKEIRKTKNCVGIKIIGNKKLLLEQGENNLEFRIEVTKTTQKNKDLHFLLGDIEISTAYPVTILEHNEFIVKIPSQLAIIDDISEKLVIFLKRRNTTFISINGLIGSGRSYILNELGKIKPLKTEYYYFVSFTNSNIWNSKLILNFILFLLFPYLNPEDIDEEYLNSFTSSVITMEIIELVRSKNKYDDMIKLFKEYLDIYDFLPNHVNINKRIVFIDDLDYLDGISLLFFLKLFREIQLKRFPIFIVFTTESEFTKNNVFCEFLKICPIENYNYYLKYTDINQLFNMNLVPESLSCDILESQLNIIELFTFFRYIYNKKNDNDLTINGLDGFITKYKIFKSSNILQNHIAKIFNEIFLTNPNCKKICDTIYSSHTPVKTNELSINTNEILQLLTCGLIKYDHYNSLMPINQVYQKYYLNHYDIDCKNVLGYDNLENSEYLKIQFENEINPSRLQQIAKTIIEKYQKRRYSYVLYVLDGIFEHTDAIELLECRINDQQLFIELYFAYTYSLHLQSTSNNSRDHFKTIISKTKNSSSHKLKRICIRAIWEMIISEYEFLNYDSSLNYIKEISQMLKAFVSKDDTILNDLKYHDAMTVKSQIDTDLYGDKSINECDFRTSLIKKYNFETRYYNTKLRLALSRSIFNIDESISTIETCTEFFFNNYGSEHKMYIIGKFSSLFYKMVYKDYNFISKVIEYHQKMKKNQYNNYRKRCYAIAAYYYMIGDVKSGNHYLFPEIYLSRNMADRGFAFYQETVALYELINGNQINAIDALNKAYKCFEELVSYNVIIKHNIHFIQENHNIIENVVFWDGKELEKDKYYLDPRIIF